MCVCVCLICVYESFELFKLVSINVFLTHLITVPFGFSSDTLLSTLLVSGTHRPLLEGHVSSPGYHPTMTPNQPLLNEISNSDLN